MTKTDRPAMPSHSLSLWNGSRSEALDEIEAAHRAVGGSGRGRRYATQQINHAYVLLLSAHFQGYCRDLYYESLEVLIAPLDATLKTTCRKAFVNGIKLNTGNPTPGNIGSDFARLGLDVWHEVQAMDLRNKDRQNRVMRLNDWRNAIAHQDLDRQHLGTGPIRLDEVRRWRQACDRLAHALDEVASRHLEATNGVRPW